MIIYGIGGKKLLTEQLTEKCPQCSSDNSLEITIAARYFHLFWIPFFPIGKKSAVYCQKCGFVSEIPFSEQISAKSTELESGLGAPAYLFTGLVLTLLVIVFFVFRGIEKNKRTDEYVHSPKAGDIYEIKNFDNYYSLLRIEEVFDDSVYVCFHGFEVDRKSGLKELKSKKGWGLERYVYRKSELVQIYEEGYILGIDRDDKLEESGLLPYNTHYPIELESTTPAESDVNDTVKTLRPQ